LLPDIEISLWWCGGLAPRVDIVRGDFLLRRVLARDRRLAGLEIESDTVPSKPGFEIRDPLLVGVELLLLALDPGRQLLGERELSVVDG
jgi:hypothetical protein